MSTRPLTDDFGYTCDWGGCDEVAMCERRSPGHGWLPVCERHSQSHRRPSPGRCRCPSCGKEYALSVAGLFPLHRDGWNTCPGSRQAAVTL